MPQFSGAVLSFDPLMFKEIIQREQFLDPNVQTTYLLPNLLPSLLFSIPHCPLCSLTEDTGIVICCRYKTNAAKFVLVVRVLAIGPKFAV
jgi:hypothetical protein